SSVSFDPDSSIFLPQPCGFRVTRQQVRYPEHFRPNVRQATLLVLSTEPRETFVLIGPAFGLHLIAAEQRTWEDQSALNSTG
ncbi:MAG: hypothetical protein VYE53_03940, partial [Planctomycetota bacterium]|nr:hypothetical protein [Planctomycetota bacterium]